MKLSSYTGSLLKKRQENKWLLVCESLLTGAITGLVIAAFRLSIGAVRSVRIALYHFVHATGIVGFIPVLVTLAAMGLFIGFIIARWPMIKGGGVAQIEGVFMQKLQFSPLSELPLKFLGGVLCIGSGLSMGREGPSVQLGAYVGDALERFGKRSFTERVCLITAGAAAGLSATFNAPFAAIIFALEDLHHYLSPLLLACVMAGAFAGDFAKSILLGGTPIFNYITVVPFTLSQYGWLIGLGIWITLIGHCFKQLIYFFQDFYAVLRIPPVLRPAIPFLLSLPIGLWYSYALGGGDGLIRELVEHNLPMSTLLLCLTIKLLFTGISAGSGAIGGIFVPLFACGAISGALYAKLLVHFGFLEQAYIPTLMLLGMAACFTTVINAPLTACIIIFETSGGFQQLGPVVLTCFIAYLTARCIDSKAHDHILLTQILQSEQIRARPGLHKRGRYWTQLYELPIRLQSSAAFKKISETPWPSRCLIVGVIHSDHEFVPNGNTILYPGDKLIVLAEDDTGSFLEALTALTNGHP